MDKLKRLKNIQLRNLSPQKKLLCYKTILFITVGLLIIVNFTSLGYIGTNSKNIGSNYMIWTQLETSVEMEFLKSNYNSKSFHYS